MDFQCDRCGQKYHVADEKLQGRAASRFKCKKCENMILLSVQGTSAPSVVPPPPDLAAVSPAGHSPLRAPTGTVPMRPATGAPPRTSGVPGVPRPRPATTTGPAYAGAGRPSLATARAEPIAPPPALNEADENGWFAGIRDVPVGPISRAELQAHINVGDASGDTLVWRDGFGDWRPLRAVPALKDLLPALRVVAPRPSQPPLQSFAESEGDATVISDQGPALVAAALKASAPGRHDQRLQEAPTRKLSALTDEQLRSIRLPPTGDRPSERPPAPAPAPGPAAARAPVPRTQPPKAPAAPPRTPTTTAPAVRGPSFAPGAPRKSDLLAKKPSPTESTPPPAPHFETPSATASPAPLTASPLTPTPHASAPMVASALTPSPLDVLAPPPSLVSDESSDALTMPAQESSSARASLAPPSLVTPEVAAPTHSAGIAAQAPALSPGWDDPLFHPTTPPSPPSATSASPAVRSITSQSGAWSDPVFNSHPPPASAAASEALVIPVLAPITNTGPIGVSVDVARPKPRGLPRSAWVLFAGVAVVGIAGGIALTRRPPRTELAASVSEPSAQPSQSEHAAPPPAELAPQAVGEPTTPDMVFAVGDDSPAAREHRRRAVAARPAAAPDISVAQRQAQLERMMGLSPGSVSAPTPNLPALRTPTPSPVPSPSAAANPAATQSAALPQQGSARTSNTVRERTATDQIERSGVVRRCWDQFKLRNPAAPRRRLSISVAVAESGQVSLRIPEGTDAMLQSCIETRAGTQVRSLGPGAAVHTSLAVSLD